MKREKQQQTAVFSFGKRRKRYEEKSFERIVRSNDTWGSSRMWKLLGYEEAQIQHLRQRQREKTDSSSDKVTIRMSYWNSEDTVQAMLDYLAEAVTEVEIEYQFIDNSNYDTIIDTQLSAGEGPDIICESPGSALKHAKLGYLEALDDLAADYYTAGTSVYGYNGSTYALPGISWFEGIYYNKEIFEENNVELPKTFDEFLDVCTTFQNAGVTPLAAGLKSWEPLLKSSMAFVTAEYLSTDEGKGFGEKYRNGEVTMDGTWNPYIETWSQLIDNGVYTADMRY